MNFLLRPVVAMVRRYPRRAYAVLIPTSDDEGRARLQVKGCALGDGARAWVTLDRVAFRTSRRRATEHPRVRAASINRAETVADSPAHKLYENVNAMSGVPDPTSQTSKASRVVRTGNAGTFPPTLGISRCSTVSVNGT